MLKALITGSFDPPTLGHLDLIKRIARLFDETVVCIFVNSEKKYMFPLDKREKMLLVYEPVWAIGTGKQPSVSIIKDRVNYIKRLMHNRYGIDIPVLYGGSVNKDNVKQLAKVSKIDGLILGESAKDPQEVKEIYSEYLK